MKNILHFIAAAVLISCMAGCNDRQGIETPDSNLVRTTVSITGSGMTRATEVTASQEENIRNLQIFVFDESGTKEFYLDAGSSQSGEIITKEGKKTVMAVANAPSLEDAATRTALLTRTSLLSDNSLGAMVMTGEKEAVLQDGGSITIPVTRIVSKVVIRKITSNFSSSSNASKEFRVKSIYLLNVAGDNTYAATSEPTVWYNKLMDGYNDSACRSFPLLSDAVNTTIPFKSSYTKEHSFYCYPNLISAESFDSVWCPRHTMLVVDALLGSDRVYYPIELPVIGRNKCIVIEELIITKKGSDEPYKPVQDGTCNVAVEVMDWDVILSYTETI